MAGVAAAEQNGSDSSAELSDVKLASANAAPAAAAEPNGNDEQHDDDDGEDDDEAAGPANGTSGE